MPLPPEIDPLGLSYMDMPGMEPGPMDEQAALLRAVRKQPALSMPSQGVARQPVAPAQAPAAATPDYRAKAMQALQRANELATGGPPDMAQLIAQAQRREEGSGRDLAAGLVLSQLGGERTAPLGGQVLRQAMAARGPTEVPGGWGTIEGGQFIANPFKARETEVTRLEQQARIFESQAQHAETADERRLAREQAGDLRREAMQRHQENLAESRAVRAASQGEAQTQRLFQREHTLRGDYGKVTKDLGDQQQAAQQVEMLTSKPAGQMTAQDQQALIFSFMKMLDPGSVVRESEYAAARSARGVLDTVQNYLTQLQTGKPLTPSQVAGIRGVAKQMQSNVTELRGDYNRQFSETAQRWGVDPKAFIRGSAPGGEAPGGAERGRGVDVGARLGTSGSGGGKTRRESVDY